MSLDYLGSDGGDANSLDDVRSGAVVLKRGVVGNAAAVIQKLVGLSGPDVDGDYGPKTEAAVRNFQQAHGISPADGKVGKVTMAAIEHAPPVSVISFDDDVVAVKKPSSQTAPRTAGISASSKVLAETLEEPPSKAGTYVAYGLGGLAVAGLVYAFVGR